MSWSCWGWCHVCVVVGKTNENVWPNAPQQNITKYNVALKAMQELVSNNSYVHTR